MVVRVHGESSSLMAVPLNKRAEALKELRRFEEARSAVTAALKIIERVSGKGNEYAHGLKTLAGILFREGKYEMGLKHIEEARSVMKPESDPHLLATLLNLHANFLTEMKQYQKAVLVREEQMALRLQISGPNHPDYATSLENAAALYCELKQIDLAAELMTKSLAIRTKSFGPSHPLTQKTRDRLVEFEKAQTDPEMKKKLASKSDRICSRPKCFKVEKKMGICLHCKSYYLCKDHHETMDEHMAVCPNHPDALWVERKVDEIVKCRRCRKETKLMKCSVCGTVWYCGATCQKEDWKRHKLFCGKK